MPARLCLVFPFKKTKQNQNCNQDGDPACLICEAGTGGDGRGKEREGGGLPTSRPD